jgi:hypothetical protein
VAVMDELAARIEATAAAIAGVERNVVAHGTRYLLDGVEFAAVTAGAASFRLRPDLAAAALLTPGVRPGDRGPGWVDLVPAQLDQFALDRAASWFGAAARYAAEASPGRRTH